MSNVEPQQAPKGYKQTEVGIIPIEWEEAPYGEHFSTIAGVGFNKSEYSQSGLKLIRIDNVSYGVITWDSIAYLPESYSSTYEKLILKRRDILLALNRPITNGKLKMAFVGENDLPSILYQRVGKVIFLNDRIEKRYAFYILNKFIKQFVEQTAVGTDQPFISTTKLKKCKLPIPRSFDEQTAIANALSDVDALITSLEKLIAKKRAIKTAAMQQLLTGKKRLPPFDQTHTGYKQTELGEIPEDWEISSLRQICSYINDGTHHTPKYVDNGVPFYSVENVTANDFHNTKFITNEEHERLIKRCKPEKGDILLTRIGTLAKTKLVDWDVDASIYVSLALLKLNDKMDSGYVYSYTKSNRFHTDVKKRSLVNATPQKINMADIGDVPIIYPLSTKEQVEIDSVLSDMDKEIDTLGQRLNKTQQLKQGMMQELLTGRTRLV